MAYKDRTDGYTFLSASIFWIVLAVCMFFTIDMPRDATLREIEFGDAQCSQHGGLATFDNLRAYTCNDGAVIHANNLQVPYKTGG